MVDKEIRVGNIGWILRPYFPRMPPINESSRHQVSATVILDAYHASFETEYINWEIY